MGITIGLLIPLLGTMLGAAFVFFMKKDMSPRLQKSLLGFASGVMVAASVWSLLIPSIEMEAGRGAWSVLPAAIGFLAGVGFLLLLDELTPHLHLGANTPEGPRSKLSRTAMLALAVTIHNLPEGMAVGVVFAAASQGVGDVTIASAIAVSLGIAIQNIPEGAISRVVNKTKNTVSELVMPTHFIGLIGITINDKSEITVVRPQNTTDQPISLTVSTTAALRLPCVRMSWLK